MASVEYKVPHRWCHHCKRLTIQYFAYTNGEYYVYQCASCKQETI